MNDSVNYHVEGIKFEYSHGSVLYDDNFVVRKGNFLDSGGFGIVIKAHPSFRYGIECYRLCLGIRGKGINKKQCQQEG